MAAIPLPDPPLRDGAVALRPWRDSDLEAVVAACQDPLIARFTAHVPSPYGPDDAREWFAGQEPARERGARLELAIVARRDERTVLGAISLAHVELAHLRAAVGYWVAPQSRNRGIASGAVRLLTRWALGSLGLGRLELVADAENIASRRVAERCGFVPEGRMRSHAIRGGERRDSILYALLPRELD